MASYETVTISGKEYGEEDILREQDEYIKLECVDLCFALNILINDESALVRAAVARKKVGHEMLVNDSNWRVRATVAKYCDDEKLLDALINDENEYVRFIVVKRGYALKHFVNDQDEEIASIARHSLQNQQTV
ncbi:MULTISPECIES: HEAT repeat domain-containing protein [Methylobacter]|jgi:hypothetical protein|uniref:HEAT repeat domain-containing protein n=1 Tax=Methylobacter TaxID=429 RepID=UPI000366175C|nr:MULTISPECIES: HEAT repeat domain-containing protein [Methylobacter]